MDLSQILMSSGLPLDQTAVLFHSPRQPALRRDLPRLAEEERPLFEAYQSEQSPLVEATLLKRKHFVSLICLRAEEYVLGGVYDIAGNVQRTVPEVEADPHFAALYQRYGSGGFAAKAEAMGTEYIRIFQLAPRLDFAGLEGRVLVRRPVGRSICRLAERLDAPVIEISRERQLVAPPPEWRDFVVTAEELTRLPYAWGQVLRRWRGIYLITDEVDGKRYVGAAWGEENLLGRWRAHIAREKGVTVELGNRDPKRFRFSILELTLHDADPREVQAREANWKRRLHTRTWGLNAN